MSSDGVVQCTHCTCIAGLGESCNHVGDLLLKLEIGGGGVKLGPTKKSCANEACRWNSTFREHGDPTPVTAMGSVECKKLPAECYQCPGNDGQAQLP